MLIGELAKRAQVNPKTVRYYESVGLLPEPHRDVNGYRLYVEPDLERLRFIKSAQRLGFALDEITEILSLHANGGPPCSYVRERLHTHLSAIAEGIHELRLLEDKLHSALDATDEASPGGEHLCGIIERNTVQQEQRPSPAA